MPYLHKPYSQCTPPNSGLHRHEYRLPRTTHSPPFLHGRSLHGFGSSANQWKLTRQCASGKFIAKIYRTIELYNDHAVQRRLLRFLIGYAVKESSRYERISTSYKFPWFVKILLVLHFSFLENFHQLSANYSAATCYAPTLKWQWKNDFLPLPSFGLLSQ